ncbi:KAP family P-loop NTPase fold protein [Vibrio splendidus]|uniref:KAP family P-loop NTPase fold protein n=1 Tax=Vibrio splendidus TaxID=29497 RepID=UPI00076A5F5A|nr:KAP family NTPase [Vibrio splendidus]PHX03551.1 KAP family P-loop domain protein [Vibrio splendidus]
MAGGDINFDWKEPVLGEDSEGNPIELFPIDTLHRGKYAKFLHGYLVDNSSQNGYVLNLNAQWGAGKTYFINRWIDSIKEKHPVVYVDAWKQDYSDDPMLTVISSIINALEVHLPDGNQKAIALKNKATRFFKAAAPLLAKGLIKKATGMNIDEINPKDDNDSLNTDLYNLSGEAGAALAKCLVDDHNEKLKTVEYLREDIKSLIKAIDPKKNLQIPAFVFIDELDRCRPSYAVEMLEVIKHFFELEDIVFVVATDTAQLQHAVKAVYGEGFDAQTYLGRFFRRRYSLPISKSRYEFVKNMIGEDYAIKPSWNSYAPAIEVGGNLWNLISIVAGRFNLSLRDTEQLADKFLAVLSSADKSMNPYLLLTLFALRDKHYSVYECWVGSDINATTLQKVMESAGLDKTSLPLHRGNSGYFVAIEDTEAVDFSLYEMLYCMDKYSSFKSYGDKSSEERSLRANSRGDDYDAGEKNYIQLNFLGLAAKKSDYIDWVEYAVSFDE